MSLHVGTGLAAESNDLLVALSRGRGDREFFSDFFLGRRHHPGQLRWVENADATVNCLATSNRWGKTTVVVDGHYHANIYKTGAEDRYLDPVTGKLDLGKFQRVRYNTIHTADLWETAALVWDDARKIRNENPRIDAFVKAAPESKPPHIDFINGARWKFRTLGHDASGIDGHSFYLVTLDEAGWIDKLEEKMQNVIRVRIADVRGRIWLVGTFKPGVSKDFYKHCVRASAYTGAALGFDHRTEETAEGEDSETLDSSIRKYLREYGIDLDEYRDALGGH